MKRHSRIIAVILTVVIALNVPISVNAETLTEAGLTEDSRGYGGLGNQDKNRTEDSVLVRVSIGGGDSDWNNGDFSNYYVYKNDSGVVFDQYELSIGDIDNDGDIDMTDLFSKLEEYKLDGSCALDYSTSDFGDFYMDVFGISTGGSLTYKLNNIFCQAGTPDLYDGDSVVILLMTGESNMWSTIDDSCYEHVATQYDPNNVPTDWYDAGGNADGSDDTVFYSKYIDMMKANLEGSLVEGASLSDGNCYWQEMRILRNNDITDEVYNARLPYFDSYHQQKVAEAEAGKLKAVNAMRDASVTGDEQMLDYLAHGYNGKDAATWDKAAGMYAVDYILMCLDNEDYATDEEMAVNLADYAASESVRDDLINYIVTTDGCWGGGWFTYDTGAQNAQAIIPYYDMYPEVRDRVDAFLEEAVAKFRTDKSTPSAFDASSSSEVSRALCLMYCKTGDEQYAEEALELYNMVVEMGLENTKFHGNAMDVWRMALNEWGLNKSVCGDIIDVVGGVFEMFYETATIGKNMVVHLRSNEELNNLALYELVLKIPEGLQLIDVVSPVVDEVEYNLDGDELRIVIADLGNKLNITKASDVLKINFKTTASGKVKCGVLSSNGYTDSENQVAISIDNKPVDVVEPYGVTSQVLYKGNAGSKFIDKEAKVEKITFGGKVDVDGAMVVHIGDKSYDMYESKDLSTESASVYLTYIPSSITEEQLSDIDCYEVIKTSPKKIVTIGDVDENSDVDVKDALHVIRIWVGKEKMTENKTLISANVDGDSDITNADTLAIVENKVNSRQFKVLN